MRTPDSLRLTRVAVVLVLVLAVATPVFGQDDDECSLARLNGLYVFSASGFVTPPGVPAFPKAIVELIRFDGAGHVTTPAVTVAIDNQALISASPGAPGTYTVADLLSPDGACAGTLTFIGSNNTFNLVIPREHAKTIWMIQTNVTPGNVVTNVFQGTATKIAR
jgi:hypothetical protein